MRVIIVLALALSGCASMPVNKPQPEIQTVTVNKEVPVPCKALEQLGPEPVYADTDAAINAAAALPDVGERAAALAKLYAKGRLQRVQRLSEYAVAKASCLF